MLIPVSPSECDRAREAVSGRLDEELTELEGARLDVHLRRCPACREFARTAAAIAAELREARLEQPRVSVRLPRRTRVAGLRFQAAAAAAVAVAAGGSLVLGRVVGSSGGGRTQFTTSAPATDFASARRDAIEQRLLALLPAKTPRGVLRNGPVVPL